MSGITIKNEKTITKEEIVDEGIALFAEITLLATAKTSPEDIWKTTYVGHRDFISTYPIVMQYMLVGSFDAVVFAKWLQSLTLKPGIKETDFLEAQANYATALARHANPHMTSAEAAKFKRQTNLALSKERKEFREKVDAVSKKIDAKNEMLLDDRKREILAYIAEHKDELLANDNDAPIDRLIIDRQ